MFYISPKLGADLLQMGWRNTVMLAEAQAVITMRLCGMMGFWPVSGGENNRMVTEKLTALQESQAAALRAMLRGGSLAQVSEAAMRPVRRRTRANAKRLSRR